MSTETSKSFDCVASMRDARDAINSEIENMNHNELVEWLRSHQYEDPILKRLSERASLPSGSSSIGK